MIFELIRKLFLYRLRNSPLSSYVYSLCHLESLFMRAVNYGSKFVFAATPEAVKIIVCLCPGLWCLLCHVINLVYLCQSLDLLWLTL